MNADRRDVFVRKWFKRALEDEDPFDRFFSLWVALVVAATKYCNDRGLSRPGDTDGQRTHQFLKGNQPAVLRIMDARAEHMKALAERRGTSLGTPVLDVDRPEHHRGQELIRKLERFSRHYRSAMPLSDAEKVDALAEILNKVRNNTFHGVKVYDDQEDVRVLNLVNPVLEDVLRAVVGASHDDTASL